MLFTLGQGKQRPFDIGVTGLTLTLTISKNGAAFVGPFSSLLTEIGATGIYTWDVDNSDVLTLGSITYQFAGSGLPVPISYPVDTVVPAFSGAVIVQ